MKSKVARLMVCLACLWPAVHHAQTTVNTLWGPQQGSRELTFSAGGASSRDFDDSVAALDLSYGYYFTPTLSAVLRQSLNYADSSAGDSLWNGSTRIGFDQHFGDGVFRPFLGVTFGRIYGESVRDTWAAGLEGGAKYYVQPQTFIQTTVEYGWHFERARNVNNRFSDGQWTWSLGLGFNF